MREVAVQIHRITGYKTAYGNDHFKAIGVAGPFVRVDVGNSDKKSSSKKTLESRALILKTLERFYSKTPATDAGSRLILRNIGIYGDFLIINQNAETIVKLSPPVRRKSLERHTKEFDRLAKFLSKIS